MASLQDFHIDAGATFAVQFRYKNADQTLVDLTGYTAEFQMRRTAASPIVALQVTPSIDVLTGIVSLTIPAASASLLAANKYVYALELHGAGGNPVIRLIEGSVFVSPEVVR